MGRSDSGGGNRLGATPPVRRPPPVSGPLVLGAGQRVSRSPIGPRRLQKRSDSGYGKKSTISPASIRRWQSCQNSGVEQLGVVAQERPRAGAGRRAGTRRTPRGRRRFGATLYHGSAASSASGFGGGGMRRKLHVGQVLDLVVVVEDDAAVAGDAEVPPEHVAGEDVRDREVADRVAVVAHGGSSSAGAGAVEVDVERHHPPLDVAVADDERVAVLDHRRRERRRARRAARPRSGRAAARGSVNSSVSAIRPTRSTCFTIANFDSTVARSVSLPGPKTSLITLKTYGIGGQREDEHHLALDPGRRDEHVLRVLEVLPQVAVEERLALLAEPEHRVELGARLRRHHPAQELDVARTARPCRP